MFYQSETGGRPTMKFSYRVEKSTSSCWVICVHGFSESGECWNSIFDQLRGRANLLAYDCLGHGANKEFWRDVSFRAYVDQLGEIVRKIKAEDARRKIILVGHSQAAAIVAQYAIINSGMVDGLMLISPFFEVKEPIMALWQQFLKMVREGRREDMWSINSALLLGPKSGSWAPFRSEAIRSRVEFFPEAHLARLIEALLSVNVEGDLSILSRIPVHVVHGERDAMFPSYYSEEIGRKLPTAHFRIVKDAVHLLIELEPEVIRSLSELITCVANQITGERKETLSMMSSPR